MRKGVIGVGAGILIFGIILAVIWYPLIGYTSAIDYVLEMEDETNQGYNTMYLNEPVSINGTIETIGPDSIERYQLDWLRELANSNTHPNTTEIEEILDWLLESDEVEIITLEDLETSEDKYPAIIITDNTELSVGDDVTVEGFAFGKPGSGSLIIIGDIEEQDMIDLFQDQNLPELAVVKTVPHSDFFTSIIIIAAGVILIIAGIAIASPTEDKFPTHQPTQSTTGGSQNIRYNKTKDTTPGSGDSRCWQCEKVIPLTSFKCPGCGANVR